MELSQYSGFYCESKVLCVLKLLLFFQFVYIV